MTIFVSDVRCAMCDMIFGNDGVARAREPGKLEAWTKVRCDKGAK